MTSYSRASFDGMQIDEEDSFTPIQVQGLAAPAPVHSHTSPYTTPVPSPAPSTQVAFGSPSTPNIFTTPPPVQPRFDSSNASSRHGQSLRSVGSPLQFLRSQSTPARQLFREPSIEPQIVPKTGFVYDPRCAYHHSEEEDPHPEDPLRISHIYRALEESGCISRCVQIPARECTQEEVLLVHSQNHWNTISQLLSMNQEQLQELADSYNSIYLSAQSGLSARVSCGGVIEITKAVAEGRILNGFAIVRPPGHHAERDECMGFCLFNNVAIATKVILRGAIGGVKKIMILDWDIHHGNGIQRAFIEDPSVLYISIHRYEDAMFYPCDRLGGADVVGEKNARGKNVNIPWPTAGMDDGDYLHVFQRIVMPIAYEFSPDLVIVSAGFDAATGDDIGECDVSPQGFAHMTHQLKALASGRLVMALEGGYDLDAISASALACVQILLNEPPPQLPPILPSPECIETVQEVLQAQSRYWRCIGFELLEYTAPGLSLREMSMMSDETSDTPEMFLKKMGMSRLPIVQERLSKLFGDRVLASKDFLNRENLVIFVRDFSGLRPSAPSNEDSVSLQNSKTSSLQQIIESICSLGCAIVDIDVTTEKHDEQSINRTDELLGYLWDRYFDLCSANRFIIISTGVTSKNIIHLFNERKIENRVCGVVLIPGEQPLRQLQVQSRIAHWYFENSLVIVKSDSPEFGQLSLRPNYGRLVRTDVIHEQALSRHHDDIVQFIKGCLVKSVTRRSSSPIRSDAMLRSKSVGIVRTGVQEIISKTVEGTDIGNKLK